jgi:tetratricopeptide (TPR) repeat protein
MLQSILRGAAIACALCVSVASLSVPAHDVVMAQGADSALGKVQEGLRLYKKGDYRGAITKFDEALASNPTDEDARKIRDEINERLALDLVNNNLADPGLHGRYERFGKWILAGRKKSGYPSREKNAELIATTVADYMNDPNDVRNLERANQIRDRFGDFAVPEIAEKYMGSESDSMRYRSRALLAKLGAQAVNPIIQCMQSDNVFVRQTAALALSDISDPRALPVLAQHFQTKGEDPQVVEACRLGVSKIRALMPESDRKIESAKELWFLQAESYYRNNGAGGYTDKGRLIGTTYTGQLPVLLTGHDRTYTSWKWVTEAGERKLVDQEVPLWAYADALAEEAAIHAFEQSIIAAGGNANSDKHVNSAEALLACIRMHMYTEANGRYYSGDEAERGFIVALIGVRGMVPSMRGLGLAGSAGSVRLYQALERSLADGYPEVSVGLCDLIAKQDYVDMVGADTGKPLVRALTDLDRRVRYAAARSLLQLARDKDFGNNAMVEQLMISCLQETAARSVLVVAEDEALRNRLLTEITSLGHNAVGERTLEDGARAATLAPLYDAIVIQGDIALSPTFYWEPQKDSFSRETHTRLETIFDLLSNDIRTRQIPILIACKDAEKEERKTTLAPRVNGSTLTDTSFFGYDAEYKFDGASFNDVLKNFWDKNPESAKAKTNKLVELGCWAMHKLTPGATKYDVRKLLVGLAGGLRLDGRTSEARAAIGNAIAHLVSDSKRLDSGWVSTNLVPVLVDTLNSEDKVDAPAVRAAASWALDRCFHYYPQAFNEDAYKALLKMLRYEVNLGEIEDATRLEKTVMEVADARNKAGEALGNAPLTPAQRLEVSKAQQIYAHEPAPEKRTAK